MSSRDKILQTVKTNQPDPRALPDLPTTPAAEGDLVASFMNTLEAIGGMVYIVSGVDRIPTILMEKFPDARRIVNGLGNAGKIADPHTLENVDLAILPAHFAVAENGACWIAENQMIERALPFITQHLALVVPKTAVVPDMHAAYARIAELDAAGEPYGFATFIAGPSKTADIEQSLVLGAHGPASLTVFLVDLP